MPVKTPADLKVGDTIYVYNQDMRGAMDADRERARWTESKIIGETRISWLYEPEWKPQRFPKKGEHPRDIALSLEEVEQRIWVAKNQYHVADAIRWPSITYDQLRMIAQIVGYKERER